MSSRNELFKKALDWLYSEGKVADQRELSALTGINEVTISRILNDKVKEPSEATLRRFNAAFKNIFNMAYFRGDDVSMLISESRTQSAPVIDPSSATNAAIAAYVELTNRLKQEMAERLEDKEAIIREKDARIIALERTIADRDARIIALERQIAAYHADDLSNYPFSVGVADKLVPQNNKKI